MGDRYLRHKSVPVYDDDDAVLDEIDGKRTYDVQDKLNSIKYNADLLLDLEGSDVTFERIQRVGLTHPIRIKNKDGLGLTVPDSSNFSVSNVRAMVGSRRMVDVMECKTQRALEMSMRDFEQYFEGKDRRHIYNVISLEFSQSRLESLVQRPKLIDCLDWIDLVWPQHLKLNQIEQTNKLVHMKYPKVQKYCLMSVAGCYTDFHIDFGGTSVWYHILKGGKVFWLIEPTNENLSLYERWTMSGSQGDIFFGDMVSTCQRIELKAGNSLIIPSGWIHAVHTPLDSIVFGGNFLHSFNIPMQLRIAQVEERLHVPNRFRFPFFSEVLWYALERYVHCFTGNNYLTEEYQSKNLGNSKVNTEEKENKEYVHLTPFEYKGLQKMIETLEYIPKNKQNVPEGIIGAEELLEAAKKLLYNHSGDDHELAITGKAKAFWPAVHRPDAAKAIRKPKPYNSTPAYKKPSGTGRVRRVRCKQCEACLRDDCMECAFCKDMRKHGGPGTMKQTCIMRRCLNPILPSTVKDDSIIESPTVPTPPVVESPAPKPGKRGRKRAGSNESDVTVKVTKVEPEIFPEEESPPPRPIVPRVFVTRVPANELSRYAIRPAEPAAESDDFPNAKAWQQVVKYLSHQELVNCMLVCKDFLRWCGAPSLWSKIDLTDATISSSMLQTLVRRAPTSLNLSQTNLRYKQLLWLIERSPALRELYLVRCSWASVAALGTAACPPLRLLDLSWTSGFTDSHLKQLLSTPSDARPGQKMTHTRLRFCKDLNLTGTDITDLGVKLITNTLPHLKSLNVSFCPITDEGFQTILNPSCSGQYMLTTVVAQHCAKLTDTALDTTTKMLEITEIDLRGCEEISTEACSAFVDRSKLNLEIFDLFVIVGV
uniref:[histone H3]-dimethyl-L-lysine(36) demethylase n=1 Tax=Phallusia mammillata TaxID=59560 RepID=A0A6F9DEY7_9ASCI|nr:ZF(CXXC)-1 zinc finger protein [Phallusia mammillata]